MTPLNSADPSRPLPGEAAAPRPLALFAAITAVNAALVLAGAGARGRAALARLRPLIVHRGFRAAAALSLVLLAAGAGAHHLYRDRSGVPDLEPFIRFEPPTIGEVSDARGEVLIELAREYRRILEYDEIPPVVREAILAAEDKNFFSHSGIDYGAFPRVIWKTLDNQFDAAFAQYEKWGIKGLKIDFMQRDDQPVMNFYQRVCREAAKRKMLLDFHGAIRPATFMRTWPNVVNTEGVRGLEQNKWSKYSNPEHNVTIPFTRMFLGPMDYTPGAMVNSGLEKNFVPVFERPMSPGTRCHQLAMYVVYEAPLQMLADSPTRYLQEPEIMQLLGSAPTTWDETRVLAAKIGDYVAIARRHGNNWYIGAMTDWTPRDLELDLSFLPTGSFQMIAYQDGANSDRLGADYKMASSAVSNTSKLKIHLASGGGWAAQIRSK